MAEDNALVALATERQELEREDRELLRVRRRMMDRRRSHTDEFRATTARRKEIRERLASIDAVFAELRPPAPVVHNHSHTTVQRPSSSGSYRPCPASSSSGFGTGLATGLITGGLLFGGD